jgi:hypothetical protein
LFEVFSNYHALKKFSLDRAGIVTSESLKPNVSAAGHELQELWKIVAHLHV